MRLTLFEISLIIFPLLIPLIIAFEISIKGMFNEVKIPKVIFFLAVLIFGIYYQSATETFCIYEKKINDIPTYDFYHKVCSLPHINNWVI